VRGNLTASDETAVREITPIPRELRYSYGPLFHIESSQSFEKGRIKNAQRQSTLASSYYNFLNYRYLFTVLRTLKEEEISRQQS